jgi:hypothetical protein
MSDVKTVIMSYASDPIYDIPNIVIKKAISLYKEAKDIGFTDNNIETFINEDGIRLTFQKENEFLDIYVTNKIPIYTLYIIKGVSFDYEEEFVESTDEYNLTVWLLLAFYNIDDFFEIIKVKKQKMT